MKVITKELNGLSGRSLQRICEELGVERVGQKHQAGSDAHQTLQCYLKLKKYFEGLKIPNRFIGRLHGVCEDGLSHQITEFSPQQNSAFLPVQQYQLGMMRYMMAANHFMISYPLAGFQYYA